MARPQEMHEQHRWTGVVRALVLFGLTVGVIAYLTVPGWLRQSPDRSVDAYCKQVSTVSSLGQALTDLDPTAVRNSVPALEQLDRVAPTDIEPQVKIILDTTRSLVSPVQDAQSNESLALDKAWRPRQAEVGAIQAAGQAMQAYTLVNCKVDLGTTIPTIKPVEGPTTTTIVVPTTPTTVGKSTIKPTH